MNIVHLICLFLVLCKWHQGFANEIESTFQSLNSPHFKVWNRQETLEFKSKTHLLNQLGLSWLPEYAPPQTNDSCRLAEFQKALHSHLFPQTVLQEFWKNCEPSWRQDSYNLMTHSQEVLRTGFEPSQHPAVRVVQWLLPNQLKVRGLLFFKGPKPRPLVIIRAGIFSHLKSTVAERFLMMQLFEEAPFHVLLLPSTSGADYIGDNHQFTFGGFDEGLQTWHILDFLFDSQEPLNKYITKLHLVGISLGAHGLWLTNLIEQSLKKDRIGKTFLFCPAINLEQTYLRQNQNVLSGFFVKKWFEARLAPLRTELGLKDSETIGDYMNLKIHDYLTPSSPWPLSGLPLPGAPNPFWNWNNFWSWMPKYNYSNTFILWNDVDPVVPPSVNSELLLTNPDVPKSSLLKLPRGLHCSLPASYQWAFISTTLRGFLEPSLIGTEDKIWSQSFFPSASIRAVNIQKLEVNHQHFKVEVFIRFKNPLLPPHTQSVKVPTAISDQAWVLPDFNKTLHDSILRELTSRMSWSQDKDQWTLSFSKE